MRKRIKNVRKDKRVFARTAQKTKKINLSAHPVRGGIRL